MSDNSNREDLGFLGPLLSVAIVASLTSVCFSSYLFWAGASSERSIVRSTEGSHDVFEGSIQAAYAVGRLDIVSVCLAILGVGLVVFAFPLITYLSTLAKNTAQDCAAECAEQYASKWFEDQGMPELSARLPLELEKYFESGKGSEQLLAAVANVYVQEAEDDELAEMYQQESVDMLGALNDEN